MLNKVDQSVILYKNAQKVSLDDVDWCVENEVSMEAFCRKYKITDYKTIGETDYVIVKAREKLVLLVFSNGLSSYYLISFAQADKKAFFENICEETSFSEIQAADPGADYSFIYHNWSGYPKQSLHFFDDGDAFWILYDENGLTVSSVIRFSI